MTACQADSGLICSGNTGEICQLLAAGLSWSRAGKLRDMGGWPGGSLLSAEALAKGQK